MPSKIEWTDETWNPITGCTPISEGCRNCYAKRMAMRLAGRCGYPKDDPFSVTIHRDRLNQPFGWKKPRKIFVCSMGDLFHQDVSFPAIKAVLSRGVNTSEHTFFLLTKRPDRMKAFFDWLSLEPSRGFFGIEWPLSNVWIGVTAENQQRADERIPVLLQIPASVRFVSVEPMLGPIDLTKVVFPHGGKENVLKCGVSDLARRNGIEKLNGIDWIICGGETGPGARPMQEHWVTSLLNNCVSNNVPFFFKKWHARGGREINRKEWNEYPRL